MVKHVSIMKNAGSKMDANKTEQLLEPYTTPANIFQYALDYCNYHSDSVQDFLFEPHFMMQIKLDGEKGYLIPRSSFDRHGQILETFYQSLKHNNHTSSDASLSQGSSRSKMMTSSKSNASTATSTTASATAGGGGGSNNNNIDNFFYVNRDHVVIPTRPITKPPSAVRKDFRKRIDSLHAHTNDITDINVFSTNTNDTILVLPAFVLEERLKEEQEAAAAAAAMIEKTTLPLQLPNTIDDVSNNSILTSDDIINYEDGILKSRSMKGNICHDGDDDDDDDDGDDEKVLSVNAKTNNVIATISTNSRILEINGTNNSTTNAINTATINSTTNSNTTTTNATATATSNANATIDTNNNTNATTATTANGTTTTTTTTSNANATNNNTNAITTDAATNKNNSKVENKSKTKANTHTPAAITATTTTSSAPRRKSAIATDMELNTSALMHSSGNTAATSATTAHTTTTTATTTTTSATTSSIHKTSHTRPTETTTATTATTVKMIDDNKSIVTSFHTFSEALFSRHVRLRRRLELFNRFLTGNCYIRSDLPYNENYFNIPMTIKNNNDNNSNNSNNQSSSSSSGMTGVEPENYMSSSKGNYNSSVSNTNNNNTTTNNNNKRNTNISTVTIATSTYNDSSSLSNISSQIQPFRFHIRKEQPIHAKSCGIGRSGKGITMRTSSQSLPVLSDPRGPIRGKYCGVQSSEFWNHQLRLMEIEEETNLLLSFKWFVAVITELYLSSKQRPPPMIKSDHKSKSKSTVTSSSSSSSSSSNTNTNSLLMKVKKKKAGIAIYKVVACIKIFLLHHYTFTAEDLYKLLDATMVVNDYDSTYAIQVIVYLSAAAGIVIWDLQAYLVSRGAWELVSANLDQVKM